MTDHLKRRSSGSETAGQGTHSLVHARHLHHLFVWDICNLGGLADVVLWQTFAECAFIEIIHAVVEAKKMCVAVKASIEARVIEQVRRLLHNIVFLASGLQHNADFGKLVRPLLKLGPAHRVVNGMHSINGLAGLGHIDVVHILGNRYAKGCWQSQSTCD